MRITIIPDSYKGSITSAEACAAMAAGVKDVLPAADLRTIPIADGGEGMIDAYEHAAGGRRRTILVQGPLDEPVSASYLILPARTAVIESAAACGLTLIDASARRAALTTTYGVGQLVTDALDQGCTRIIIGLGGSATNDGGMGLMCALGAKITDERGAKVRPVGDELEKVAGIDVSGVDPRLAGCEIILASDVKNPLIGPEGAAHVFAAQKGADEAEIARLDAGMTHFSRVVKRDLGADIAGIPGAGAAGGLGGALIALAQASVMSGIDVILDACQFDRQAQESDLILTGEGKLDFQSSFGKAVYGVCTRAKRANPDIRVIALCGALGAGYEQAYGWGLDGAVSIVPGACTLDEALRRGAENLRAATADVLRILTACPDNWAGQARR